MPKPYVFPGIQSYVAAAAVDMAVAPTDVGQVHKIWHVSRVQDALGQLPNVVESHRRAVLDHAVGLRDGLAAALRAVEAAIVDAAAGVGLVVPAVWPDPTGGQLVKAQAELTEAHAALAVLQAHVEELTAPTPAPEPPPEAPKPDEPESDDPPA